MAVYDEYGNELSNVYDAGGKELESAYDAEGIRIFTKSEPLPPTPPTVDYTNYSFVQKWASKGITSQDFALYDDKVFWISKTGNDTIPSTCYIFKLSDGSQIKTVTVYSGHGNSLSIDFPTLYASTGYSDVSVYINDLANDYSASLNKTLYINDGSVALDACVDESDKTILWTHGKTGTASDTDIISKWDLTNLTDNGNGTYTPRLIYSVSTPKPETLFSQTAMYFQGCTVHDGFLWYPTWVSGVVGRIVAVNLFTGAVEYTISTGTTTEVEGVEFYPDSDAVGGYAMYIGFQGMMMRKYTFGALS